MKNGLVLVTGATGYIGGRLAPELIEAAYRVRVLVRDRNRLERRTGEQPGRSHSGGAINPRRDDY